MKKTLIVLCALLTLSGCVYANVKTPYDEDLFYTQLGSKVGRSSSHSVLWLVAWGDESMAAAAKEGDIKVLNHADQEIFSILFGLYTSHTIIVYGD